MPLTFLQDPQEEKPKSKLQFLDEPAPAARPTNPGSTLQFMDEKGEFQNYLEDGISFDEVKEEEPGFFVKNFDRFIEAPIRGGLNTAASVVEGLPIIMEAARGGPRGAVGFVVESMKVAQGKGRGSGLARSIEELAPDRDPSLDGDTLTAIFEGVGSTLTFGLMALLTGGAGAVASGGAVALAGAAAGAAEGLGQVAPQIQETGNYQDAWKASLAGSFAGLTEAVPVGRALSRLARSVPEGVAKSIIKGLFEEGGQEAVQTFITNLGVQDILGGSLLEGTGGAAVVGGGSGAIINAVAAALGVRTRRNRAQRSATEEAAAEGESAAGDVAGDTATGAEATAEEKVEEGVEAPTTPKEAAQLIAEIAPPPNLDAIRATDPRDLVSIRLLREDLGLDARSDFEQRSWARAIQQAMDAGMHKEQAVEPMVEGILTKPRAINDVEYAALQIHAASLRTRHLETLDELSRAVNSHDYKKVEALEAEKDLLFQRLDQLSAAERLAIRETARGLSFVRSEIDRFSYTPGNVMKEMQAAKGASLTPEEQQQAIALVNKVAEARRRRAEIEKNADQIADEEARQDALKEFEKAGLRREQLEKLEAEDKAVKEELRKRFGINLYSFLTGMDPRDIYAWGKHFKLQIQKGSIKTMDELVEYAKSIGVGFTERDVYDALLQKDPSAKGKPPKKTPEQQLIEALTVQADVLKQIEDAQQGLFKIKLTNKQTPEEVKAVRSQTRELRKKLVALRQTVYATEDDQVKLSNALNRINQVVDTLNQRFNQKGPFTMEDIQSVQDAINQMRQWEKTLRIRERIAKIEADIRAGNVKKPVKKEKAKPIKALQEAEIEEKMAKAELRAAIANMKPLTFRTKEGRAELRREGFHFFRAMMATGDMSSFMRQGLLLSLGHPEVAVKAIPAGVKAFANPRFAHGVDLTLRKHPRRWQWERAGLYIAPLEVSRMGQREEAFQSRLIQKIPGLRIVARASERAYVTHLNLLRANVFDHWLERFPDAPREEQIKFAKFVNAASGRGNLSASVAHGLSGVLFAPRFQTSRFETFYRMGALLSNPKMRKEFARHVVGVSSLAGSMVAMAALSGLDIGDDPWDSDFGKLILGRTRIDLLGGFQQPVSFVLRGILGSGAQRGLWEDESPGLSDIYDLVSRYAQFRLHPSISLGMETLSGKTVVGEESSFINFMPGDQINNPIASHLMPLFIQDLAEAVAAQGVGKGIVLGGLSFTGVATNTFGDELDAGDIKPILRSVKYSPEGPKYPDEIKSNKEFTRELDGYFDSFMAQRIRQEAGYLNSLSVEDRRKELEVIAAEVREEVRAIGGF